MRPYWRTKSTSSVPDGDAGVVADADRLLRRRVRVLSEDEVDLSERPGSVGILPWHEDFIHGYRWNPRKFFKRIDIPYGQADIKVPWELSRCHHLPILGMAFAATDDARYAQEVVAQIEDWIARNPVGFGVNWVSTMDVAIRAVNWLWAYRLIADGYPCTDAFVTQLLASLVRHARHIQSNIETYRLGITTNHTFADYVGLLFLGLLLPALREAHGWADTGREGILRCMREQVTEDGVDYENSISYHRLVLEMSLSSYLLADRNGCPFPAEVRSLLERMLDFVHHYTRPDGLAPIVGDCDDGRLLILHDYFSWQSQDHRYLLAIGAEMFGRQDFAAAAAGAPGGVENAAWMLGREPRGSKAHGSAADEPRRSRAFRQGGRYVMRHHDNHAVICADEVGARGLGNHKHNDIFSFELLVSGTAVGPSTGLVCLHP